MLVKYVGRTMVAVAGIGIAVAFANSDVFKKIDLSWLEPQAASAQEGGQDFLPLGRSATVIVDGKYPAS